MGAFVSTLVVLGACAAGSLRAPALHAQVGVDEPVINEISDVTVTQKLGAEVDLSIELVDESGKPVEIRTFFDGTRPVILNLAYFSCPVLCNLVTNGLIDAVADMEEQKQWTVGDEFRVLTVSIDPRDTPAMARGRKQALIEDLGGDLESGDANQHPALAGWPILTGEEANVRALADAVGFGYKWSEYQEEYAHGSAIILLSPDGKVTRYFDGIAYDPEVLRLSLVEASEGKVGSLIDRAFLTCFYYDPEKATYGIKLAWILMRVGAICTITALCAAFFFMSRNRRHTHAAPEGARDES